MIYKLGSQKKHFCIYDKLCLLSRLILASWEGVLSRYHSLHLGSLRWRGYLHHTYNCRQDVSSAAL